MCIYMFSCLYFIFLYILFQKFQIQKFCWNIWWLHNFILLPIYIFFDISLQQKIIVADLIYGYILYNMIHIHGNMIVYIHTPIIDLIYWRLLFILGILGNTNFLYYHIFLNVVYSFFKICI